MSCTLKWPPGIQVAGGAQLRTAWEETELLAVRVGDSALSHLILFDRQSVRVCGALSVCVMSDMCTWSGGEPQNP